MKRTLRKSEMVDTLMGDEYANWSYNGASALIEWLEQFEEDTGEEMKFDRVALRCEFSEWESATDCMEGQGYATRSTAEELAEMDEEEKEAEYLETLHESTLVIEFEGGIIIQDF